MKEFDLIAQYFAPLATHAGAMGLKDDAAILNVPSGQQLVATTDALIAGVHFIGTESADAIAHKALAVNLSDLAAMGSAPLGYLLALMLPQHTSEEWLQSFASGLRAMQETYGIALLGGDTTRTSGPLSLSVTAFGLVPQGKSLLRGGAQAGDDVYVSGTIGDAALGLRVAQESRTMHHPRESQCHPREGGGLSQDSRLCGNDNFLLSRYERPTPRIALGQALREIATACMDVSDGLLQDLGHICTTSGVGATLIWTRVPLSEAARSVLPQLANPHQIIMAGGDDYELLFTVPPENTSRIATLSTELSLPLTKIGVVTQDKEVKVVSDHNTPLIFSRAGYQHF